MNSQYLQQTTTISSYKDVSSNQQQNQNPFFKNLNHEPMFSLTSQSNTIPILMQKHQNRNSNIIVEENQSSRTNLSSGTFLQQINQGYGNSVEKQPSSEQKQQNIDQLTSQYKKHQARQFTLGNEFEPQTANFLSQQRQSINGLLSTSQDQFIGSSNNMNNTSGSSNFQGLQRGSVVSMVNVNIESEQIRQIISDLQSRVTRLEERVESNEEKIELNERLCKLKDQQLESSQLTQLSINIKNDVEKYVQSVIEQQQQECDRTVDIMRKLEEFEKRLKNSDDNHLKFVNDIDIQFKETNQSQISIIDKVMKITKENSQQIEKSFDKYADINSKFTEIDDKIKLLQQNITLNKDEANEYLKQYENSLEQLTRVQNNITGDLKQNITPSIKAVEDDLFRILQNYKEISDSINISKYLDQEVILMKHKIKVIQQKININQSWQVNSASIIASQHLKTQ